MRHGVVAADLRSDLRSTLAGDLTRTHTCRALIGGNQVTVAARKSETKPNQNPTKRNLQDTASSTATNKTELSQKVEAELFGEYDAMVPGPAASLAAVGASDAVPEGKQKRSGRPLAINLDLLTYHARQKSIKVWHSASGLALRR